MNLLNQYKNIKQELEINTRQIDSNSLIHENIYKKLLQLWKDSIKSGELEIAIRTDDLHYINYVKRYENVDNWNQWQNDTLQTRIELSDLVEKLTPLNNIKKTKNGKFFIVYIAHSGLAHEAQIARNLKSLREAGNHLEYEIIYLTGTDKYREQAEDMFQTNKIRYLKGQSISSAAEILNKIVQEQNPQTIIYPSIFWFAYWMSLFIQHPNQKFLQMKYYPLHAGRIAVWAGGQRDHEQYYNINGCDFEQLPVLNPGSIGSGTDTLKKDAFTKKVTLGSISRPEKTSNPKYNQFINKILNINKNSQYLYTCKSNSLHLVPDYIKNHDQSINLGWVKPLEVIDYFNIYLEPFPWGGGDMTFLALSRGIPYLILKTRESEDFGLWSFLKLIQENKDPILDYSFCDDLPTLELRIAELITNSDLRKQLGYAWKRAIHKHDSGGNEKWLNFLTH